MKKIIAIVLALVMVLGMVACGETQPAGQTEGGEIAIFWYTFGFKIIMNVKNTHKVSIKHFF